MNEYDGNSCYERVTEYDSVSFDKSDCMSGDDDSWRQVFTSDDYFSITHMDGCSTNAGHYFAFHFPSSLQLNAFRVECGGNGESRNIQMNVFDIQYHDGSDWVTVGTTDTADKVCGNPETSGYAEWEAGPTSSQWKFVLTEHHGGPWYHGFAWYTATDAALGEDGNIRFYL